MKMKKTTLGMMLGATLLATSCISEEQNLAPSEQTKSTAEIVLNLSADAQFGEQTRALNEESYRNTFAYTVRLLQDGKVLQTWTGPQSTLNKEIEIGPNNYYTVEAYYGTEYPASRNDFYVYGRTSFELKAKEQKSVNVPCYPTCGKLSVKFDEAMATYYDDYSVTYGGTQALGNEHIVWAKGDSEPWYVKLNSAGEKITYQINLTAKEEYAHVNADGSKQATGSYTGEITLLKPNQAHKLTVKPKYMSDGVGTFTLDITIDETTNNIEKNWTVPVEWL